MCTASGAGRSAGKPLSSIYIFSYGLCSLGTNTGIFEYLESQRLYLESCLNPCIFAQRPFKELTGWVKRELGGRVSVLRQSQMRQERGLSGGDSHTYGFFLLNLTLPWWLGCPVVAFLSRVAFPPTLNLGSRLAFPLLCPRG